MTGNKIPFEGYSVIRFQILGVRVYSPKQVPDKKKQWVRTGVVGTQEKSEGKINNSDRDLLFYTLVPFCRIFFFFFGMSLSNFMRQARLL